MMDSECDKVCLWPDLGVSIQYLDEGNHSDDRPFGRNEQTYLL